MGALRIPCGTSDAAGGHGRMVPLRARQVSAGKSPAVKGASFISLNPPERLPENSVSAALCAALMR